MANARTTAVCIARPHAKALREHRRSSPITQKNGRQAIVCAQLRAALVLHLGSGHSFAPAPYPIAELASATRNRRTSLRVRRCTIRYMREPTVAALHQGT